VHPYGDRPSLRVHPQRLSAWSHALEFLEDFDFHSDLSTRKLLVQRDSKMTWGVCERADDQILRDEEAVYVTTMRKGIS
jgi:hypothetical protein